MRSLIIMYSILIVAFFSFPVTAQHSAHHPEQGQPTVPDSTAGMMSGGMMGMMNMHGSASGMMDDNYGMKKQVMLINQLPELKVPLSLTDRQVEKLQQIQKDFRKNQIDLNASLAKKKIDLDVAINKSTSISDIRAILEEMSEIRISMALQAYETAGKMKDILTQEQREKLTNQNTGSSMMPGMMH